MNYAPSRYQFKSDAEFETAMNEWTAENEPRVRYMCKVSEKQHGDPLIHSNLYASWKAFYTPEERAAWLAQHPELTLLEVTEDAPCRVVTPRYAPADLAGGSRDDYRMAGYRTF